MLSRLQTKWKRIDYVLVAVVGLVCLAVSYRLVYRGATLSDEVVYTVIARNIVERGTLNTTIYRADSIILRGYPRRDHHMAGYPLTLAGMFALFGVGNKVAMGLPGQLAYLLAGLVIYGVGKTLFRPAIGFWAAWLFYVYPVSFISANLVLAESPLNLLAVIYMAYWFKISRADKPRLLDVALLAVVLVLGMVYRETMIIFLPLALFVLAKYGWQRQDYRPLIGFSLVFALAAAGLYWPLSQNRGYYPFPFNRILVAEDWTTRLDIFKTSVLDNFSLTAWPLDAYYYAAAVNVFLGVVTTILGVWLLRRSQPALVFLFIYLFWVSLVFLTTLHTNLFDWATPRHMFTFCFPMVWLIPAAIFQIKSQLARYLTLVLVIIFVGWLSVQVAVITADYQERTVAHQQTLSNAIARYLKPYAPQSVMCYKAFTSAWDHYPMTLIWTYPNTYQEMQALENRLTIDAIVVNTEQQRDVILDAGRTGLLKQRYISLFPYKVEGLYFLINERLQR